jgi:hypothetical protein
MRGHDREDHRAMIQYGVVLVSIEEKRRASAGQQQDHSHQGSRGGWTAYRRRWAQ